ncbi:MAG: redoxin domain-containing protein [Haloarculaceae archaeon]
MVTTGDHAPDFTAPLANGDVDSFTLSERLDEAPLVFAFFPGAFTSTCSHELETFEERVDDLADAGATLYGVSVDLPFALNAFRSDLGLSFGLLSDSNREVVRAWDVTMDFVSSGVDDVAKRAVFVVNGDGAVAYDWVTEDAGIEPDYDAVVAAVDKI